MQAVTTKYKGPTNTRGSRVIAFCAAGRVVIEWDDGLNSEQNHARAARALADKFDWNGSLIGGTNAAGEMVWIFQKNAVQA